MKYSSGVSYLFHISSTEISRLHNYVYKRVSYVLWHVDPLLDNDREITVAVAK
jgi:hypothetical protein